VSPAYLCSYSEDLLLESVIAGSVGHRIFSYFQLYHGRILVLLWIVTLVSSNGKVVAASK
jgi:hypothetical protein